MPGGTILEFTQLIAVVAISVIAFVFLFALLRLSGFLNVGKTLDVRAQAPTLLTSLGILGTFAGVSFGLWNFDVNDVQGSVPRLLEGLQIAFLTSIAGLGSAILLKSLILIFFPDREAAEEGKQEFDDLVEAIKKSLREGIRDALGENFSKFQESIANLIRWQNAYKTDMDMLIEEFRKGRVGIEETFRAIKKIEESSQNISKHAAQMEALFATLDRQGEKLSHLLASAPSASEDAEKGNHL